MELKREPNVYCFIGKPKSGKSYMIKSLIKQLSEAKYFAWGVCITSTNFTDDYNYIPKESLWEYDESRLAKYVTHLQEMTTEKKIHPNFMILDDLLGKINTSTPFWINFLSTFRKTQTSLFFASQYLQAKGGSSTLMREIADFSFCFRTMQLNSIKGLYNAFGQMFDTEDKFKAALMDATKEKHHVLCYKNGFDTIEDSYSEFFVDPVEDFKLKF
jgi:hypothetical protein